MHSANVSKKRKPEERFDSTSDSSTSSDELDNNPVDHAEKHILGGQLKRARTTATDDTGENGDEAGLKLYRAMCSTTALMADLALDWVEDFQASAASSSVAVAELLNMILHACGCKQLVQPHDVLNHDSAAETVTEISVLFSKTRFHEYPFVSKNKNIKFFRANVIEFFENIIVMSHENGALYRPEDSSNSSLMPELMETVLAWLVAFSESTVRPLRYVSTVLLLHVQSLLCDLHTRVMSLIDKQRRQLSRARNQSQRNLNARQRKIETISESLQTYTHQQDTISECMSEIVKTTLVRRYRDVDQLVRVECLRSLTTWMILNPEHFLQADYLRYFGWLLSDPADTVKEEVLKQLTKLLKHITGKREATSAGLDQFLERFTAQLINMLWVESSPSVLVNLLCLHCELFKLGFLEHSEVIRICLFGFLCLHKINGSQADNKVTLEVCMFFAKVCEVNAAEHAEPYSHVLANSTSSLGSTGELDLNKCFFYRRLIELLVESHDFYAESQEHTDLAKETSDINTSSATFFTWMCASGQFTGDWELLIKYLLADFSAFTLSPFGDSGPIEPGVSEEISQKLELATNTQKGLMLSLLFGALTNVIVKTADSKSLHVNQIDDALSTVTRLLKYLLPLEHFAVTNPSFYQTFMKVWTLLLTNMPSSLVRLFAKTTDVADYNNIHKRVLNYFVEFDPKERDVQRSYDPYLAIMSQSFNDINSSNNTESLLCLSNTVVAGHFDSTLLSLTNEAVDALTSIEALADFEDLVGSQGVILNRLLQVHPAILKLCQAAKFTNINKYTSEPILHNPQVLLDLLQINLIEKLNVASVIAVLPTQFAKISSDSQNSIATVLQLIVYCFSWKLEDLTYASGDDTAKSIDVEIFLDDFVDVFFSIEIMASSLKNAVVELNEVTVESNTIMRSMLQDVVALEISCVTSFVDFVSSLRVFYEKFKGSEVFKNFDKLFESEKKFKRFCSAQLSKDSVEAAMHVFFIQEARLASRLCVTLDRDGNEDTNVQELVFPSRIAETEVSSQAGLIQSTGGAILNDSNDFTWAAEKELCVFAIKLLALYNTSALPSQVIQRLSLNQARLGQLYKEITSQQQFSGGTETAL